VNQVMSGRLARPVLVPHFGGIPWRSRVPLGVPIVCLIIAAAAVLTVLDAMGRVSALGYQSPAAHAAIATLAGFAGFLAGLLIFGRFRHAGELWCLLAAVSLLLLGATDLVFAVPTSEPTTPFLTWFALIVRVAARLLLAVAAIVPLCRVERPLSLSVRFGAGAAAGVLLAGLGAWTFRTVLPVPHDAVSPALAVGHWFSMPGPILVLQLVSGGALALAAFGFQRRARATGDELMLWLAAGALLGSLASVNYVLFPSNLSQWVYVGDLLRPAFFGLVFVGAVREVAAYQARLAVAAAEAERGRLARDLHDGIAQELAFITTQARLARRDSNERWIADVTAAAERALGESRRTLRVLTNGRGSLAETLVSTAEDVAHRAGAGVRIEADDGLETSAETHEALVRIVREAVTNAVRHGGAKTVTIRLRSEHGELRLTIADDGVGFDPLIAAHHGSGFGLASMKARAGELGGHVRIESRRGAGTSIEVWLP
jgi:signal transduction histidine kinase